MIASTDRRGGVTSGAAREESDLVLRFCDADWDVADSRSGVADIHPYPAKFVPEIPALALDLLEPRGRVIDPFCGSGTTLVEAARRGLPATGVDLNPIACLISRVKSSGWSAADDAELARRSERLRAAAVGGVDDPDLDELIESIPRVEHWFPRWARRFMAGAVSYISALSPDDPWRDRLALALSSATVRISRQDSDTRYAAVEKDLSPEMALRFLERALARMSEWCRDHASVMADADIAVLEQNARDLSNVPDESASCAIFSPPYPNAYEYWLYHKYRMYWLGFDPVAVRAEEIGARPHYSGSGTATADDFRREMQDVFEHLHRILVVGSRAVVVVGDSQIRGAFVDNADVLRMAAEPAGFTLEAHAVRRIRRGSSSFNRRHSRARSDEHVLLFHRSD